MIKPFFVSFSVASIGELFDARLLSVSEKLAFINTSHYPQAPKTIESK